MPHSNECILDHPSGVKVYLYGTQHVSVTHGSHVGTAVERLQPARVVLELDEDRFQQADFRLRHLLAANTAALMQLMEEPWPQSVLTCLLPDAFLWSKHKQHFALVRNEGVPLLLGSLYGADFLHAAIAASGNRPQAAIVLADQPQHVTLARFRALTDTMAAVKQHLWAVLSSTNTDGAPQSNTQQAHDQSPQLPTGPPVTMQQLGQVMAAAANLAASRMLHLCMEWWSMVLSSRARWYGDNIHPVFLLLAEPQLQAMLTAQGCEGVEEAAAAAQRLLDMARQGSSCDDDGGVRMALLQDLQAVRRFAVSLEDVMWLQAPQDPEKSCSSGSSGSCSSRHCCFEGVDSSSSSSSRSIGDRGSSTPTGCSPDIPSVQSYAADAGVGFSQLLWVKPWWVTLSETFCSRLSLLDSTPHCPSRPAAAAVQGLEAAASLCNGGLGTVLPDQSHANLTAAVAYDRAVMFERNRVLATALWRQAADVAAEAQSAVCSPTSLSSPSTANRKSQLDGFFGQAKQQQGTSVVAVVGFNHLPGIAQVWRQLQIQDAPCSSSSSSKSDHSMSRRAYGTHETVLTGQLNGTSGTFLPWQVTMTDVAAGALELAAAGAAGLLYLAGVKRYAAPAATAAAGDHGRWLRPAATGPRWKRLVLLTLPAAVGFLPLQLDAKRLQEASQMLSKVSIANDALLQQEALHLTHVRQQPAGVQECRGHRESESLLGVIARQN